MADVILLGLDQDNDKEGIISQNERCEFIGLEYVRAYSSMRGVDIRIIDSSSNIEDILAEHPSIVGLSVMSSNYISTRKFSKTLKEMNSKIKIVWGGPHATTFFEEGLKNREVDYVVIGEGEKTFFDLARLLKEGTSPDSLEGTALIDDSSIIVNPARKRMTMEEIDSIDPRILHQENDYSRFYAKQMPHSVPASEMNFAVVSGSRGCWNDCSFCSSNSMWGRKIVYRSPEMIVDEIKHLVDDKDVNFVFFADDDFLSNSARAENIAGKILERGIKTNLHIMASVRSASRFSNYDMLRRSGVKEITVGMETTNQDIINMMGKGYDISILPFVANEITAHGIHLGLYYMLGYPGQKPEDLKHDYNFIQKLPFSRIRAVFATPYPGTRLYDQVEKEDLWLYDCRNNWQHFNNDRPVIMTPSSPEMLIDARKKILQLYFSDDYDSRMRSMHQGDVQSKKAYEEFKLFEKKVIS